MMLMSVASLIEIRQRLFKLLRRPVVWLLFMPLIMIGWLLLHLWAMVGWWASLAVSIMLLLVWRLSFKQFLILIALHYTVFVISVIVIFAEHQLLHAVLYGRSNSLIASMSQRRELGKDQAVTVDLLLSKYDQSVNLVQLDIKYDQHKLELLKFDYSRSFARIVIQEIIDNKTGFARVVVAVPNPGIQQSEALVGTAVFQTQQAGLTNIMILPSSKVLANDGRATNIFKEQQGIALFIGELTRDSTVESQTTQDSAPVADKISLLMSEEILPNPIIFTRSRTAGGLRDTILTKVELFDSIIVGRYQQLLK